MNQLISLDERLCWVKYVLGEAIVSTSLIRVPAVLVPNEEITFCPTSKQSEQILQQKNKVSANLRVNLDVHML